MDTKEDPEETHREPITATPEVEEHEPSQPRDPQTLGPQEELPLTVHLKGYEDYFSEFSWDAKKVMDVLGIKRSRLNQISGEELRVGKARIDRYLRPIYRPEDVKEYLEWTKPTASHKRSTSIIDEARLKLDQTSENLRISLSGHQEELRADLDKLLKKTLHEMVENTSSIGEHFFYRLKKLLETMREALLAHQETDSAPLEALKKEQALYGKQLTNLNSAQETLFEKVESLCELLEEVSDKMFQLQDDQVEIRENLDNNFDFIKKSLGGNRNNCLSLSERRSSRNQVPRFSVTLKPKKPLPISLQERKRSQFFS